MLYSQETMNKDIAISVRQVSKKFRLFSSAKERLAEALHPFRKQFHHEFWALNDINFELKSGQTIGILGRNGSGKSTLLQIICGVMQATQGEVHVSGRIAALLELGAGFNPNFTGRENAILNGAIMGISRKDMVLRLLTIENFADIGQFFDQPVKTYSSGMYARLAFACAINVDPDILVVDEALSVGDAKFQNKCYMQFKRIQASGKTIIFVSHSTEAILRNCDSALLLDGGRLVAQGEPQAIVDRYYELLFPPNPDAKTFDLIDEAPISTSLSPIDSDDIAFDPSAIQGICEQRNSYNHNEFRFGDREVEVADYVVTAGRHLYPTEIQSGSPLSLSVRFKVNNFNGLLSVGLALKTVDGVKLYGTNTISNGVSIPRVNAGESFWVRFDISANVGPGDLFIDIGCGDWSSPPARPLDRRHSLIHLVVSADGKFDGLSNCFAKLSVFDAPVANTSAKNPQTISSYDLVSSLGEKVGD